MMSISRYPGVGELVPAKFAVPENTIKRALSFAPPPASFTISNGMGELAAARFVVPQNTLKRAPGASLGELVAACFAVPQNTLKQGLAPVMLPSGLACLNCGQGMGALDMSSLSELPAQLLEWAQSQPWTVWAAAGGALALLYFYAGGGGSKSSYRKELSESRRQLKEKYPRRGTRLYRSAKAAVSAAREAY